jgi:hypothetical protein
MKIYIDDDFRCHTSNPDGIFREFDVPFFDDKCTALIEGYRYEPAGEGRNGEVYPYDRITPAVDYTLLKIAQDQYEQDIAEAAASYWEGVNAV